MVVSIAHERSPPGRAGARPYSTCPAPAAGCSTDATAGESAEGRVPPASMCGARTSDARATGELETAGAVSSSTPCLASSAAKRRRARCTLSLASARDQPIICASSALLRPSQATSPSTSRSSGRSRCQAVKRRQVGRQRVAPNRRQRLQLKGETLAQSAIALLAAPLVRHWRWAALEPGCASRPAELLKRRQAVKRLRDQVGGILRSRRTAQRIAQDPWIGGLVEQAELLRCASSTSDLVVSPSWLLDPRGAASRPGPRTGSRRSRRRPPCPTARDTYSADPADYQRRRERNPGDRLDRRGAAAGRYRPPMVQRRQRCRPVPPRVRGPAVAHGWPAGRGPWAMGVARTMTLCSENRSPVSQRIPAEAVADRALGLQNGRRWGAAQGSGGGLPANHWWAHVDSNHGPLPYQSREQSASRSVPLQSVSAGAAEGAFRLAPPSSRGHCEVLARRAATNAATGRWLLPLRRRRVRSAPPA